MLANITTTTVSIWLLMPQLALPTLEMRSRWRLIFSPLGWGSGTGRGYPGLTALTVLSGSSSNIPVALALHGS